LWFVDSYTDADYDTDFTGAIFQERLILYFHPGRFAFLCMDVFGTAIKDVASQQHHPRTHSSGKRSLTGTFSETLGQSLNLRTMVGR